MNLKMAALKMINTIITAEQKKEIIEEIIKMVIAAGRGIEIDPLRNEAAAAAMFYESNDKLIFTVAILSPENEILRFEHTQEVEALAQQIINNY